jgi:hypothetical protein
MNLNDLHRRLLRDVLEIGNALPFVITGGYAVQAHGLVDRLSQDIDVATNSFQSMEEIASVLVEGLIAHGWQVHVIGIEPVSARFMITDPELGEQCEVDEFSLEELAIRLDRAQWYEDEVFASYGRTLEEITDIRHWAQSWADDIRRRLYTEEHLTHDDSDE